MEREQKSPVALAEQTKIHAAVIDRIIKNEGHLDARTANRIARVMGLKSYHVLLSMSVQDQSPQTLPLPQRGRQSEGLLSEDETRHMKELLRAVIQNREHPMKMKEFSQRSSLPEPTISKLVTSKHYSKQMRVDIALKIASGLGYPSLADALGHKEGGNHLAADLAVEEDPCAINIRLLPSKKAGLPRSYALEITGTDGPAAFFTFKSHRIDAQDQLMYLVRRIVDRRAGPMVAGIMLRQGLEQMRLMEGGMVL